MFSKLMFVFLVYVHITTRIHAYATVKTPELNYGLSQILIERQGEGSNEDSDRTHPAEGATLAQLARYFHERDKAQQKELEDLRLQLREQQGHFETLGYTLINVKNELTKKNKEDENVLRQDELDSIEMSGFVFSQPSMRKRRSIQGGPIAFFVTLNKNMEHVGLHQPIVFENVVTNIGSAYNNHSGSFVAPVNGIYVFSTSLFTPHKSSYHACFVKNGRIITTMYAAGAESAYDTTSHTIVLHLQQGDDVCVWNRDTDRLIAGGAFSIFSGYLLQEYY